jgi:hypothetical protein
MVTKRTIQEIELHPDGWQRFERAMKVVAKAPPQHRAAKPKVSRGKSRRPRVRKPQPKG